MTSITDVVKEGLKYPFNDGKKVLTLGAIFLLTSLISLAMQYFVYDSIKVMADKAPIETVQAAFAAIPPSNMALVVLSWIATFVIMLYVSGYLYNVIKYSIESRYELPEFNNFKEILINGIKLLIVNIVYAILPMILFLLGLMLAVNQYVGSSVNSIGAIILFIAAIFTIIVELFEIMAVCNMIAKDELAAAFRFSEILGLIKNIGWFRFIGIAIFTLIVIGILSLFVSFIFGAISFGISMIVGSALALALVNIILESLFLNPYLSIVISRIYGSIYREANDLESEDNSALETI